MTIQPHNEYPPIPAQPPQPYYGPPRPTSGKAIAALVLGILGVPLGFVFIGIACSILAVIFGHLGLEDIKATGQEGKGLAIAGLILGYIQLAIWSLIILVIVIAVGV